MTLLGTTPSQTVGPFFSIGLPWPDGPYVVAEGTPGAVWLRGTVLDGAGDPVADALVETWQADPDGRYDGDFRGFGRCPTDDAGRWGILTLKPGRVDGEQAPHVAVSLFMRGLLQRVVTRIYFADEPESNAVDPVLTSVEEARRSTLLAERAGDGYRLDFHMQGERETVFFAI